MKDIPHDQGHFPVWWGTGTREKHYSLCAIVKADALGFSGSEPEIYPEEPAKCSLDLTYILLFISKRDISDLSAAEIQKEKKRENQEFFVL